MILDLLAKEFGRELRFELRAEVGVAEEGDLGVKLPSFAAGLPKVPAAAEEEGEVGEKMSGERTLPSTCMSDTLTMARMPPSKFTDGVDRLVGLNFFALMICW